MLTKVIRSSGPQVLKEILKSQAYHKTEVGLEKKRMYRGRANEKRQIVNQLTKRLRCCIRVKDMLK